LHVSASPVHCSLSTATGTTHREAKARIV
jgi:hypothetical protein